MGLFDFVKNQFIEVIEATDFQQDRIVFEFPVAGHEIKMGAQLIVREGQCAIFLNEGTLADVFGPGHYTLSTENMPVLSKLKAWKYGFNSPFKAEVSSSAPGCLPTRNGAPRSRCSCGIRSSA